MNRWLAVAAFVAVGMLQAQPAWVSGTTKWSGSIEATADHSETDLDGGKHTLQMRLRGSFELSPPTDGSPYSYVGNLTGTFISITYRGNGELGCPFEDVFDASGPTIANEPTARLTTRTANWNFTGGIYRLRGDLKRTYKCPDGTETEISKHEPSVVMSLPTLPYPSTGQALSTSGTIEFPVNFGSAFFNNTRGTPFQYKLVLTPGAQEELELELSSAQYQDWRPSTLPDGGDGAPIEFTATLKTKSGGVPQQKISRLEWELVDTSREPGIAINWPAESPGNLHDLYFKDQPSLAPPVTRQPVGDTGQKVAVEFLTGEGLTDKISIYPRDWGGWSILRATATLKDGKKVVGRYRGASETDVRLPDRDAGEFIARSWIKAKAPGGKSRDDLEDSPEGDGNGGDGLTLYEEYRGFFEQGERKEGDPRKKDYFAVNLSDAAGRGGLALFQRSTGLAVHRLNRNELSPTRVINHNVSAGPRTGPQHGVIIEQHKEFVGYAKAESRIGRPSTPRDIEFVGLPEKLPSRPTASPAVSYASTTVAHELLHTVNVFHHGESDRTVFWSRSGDQLFEQETVEIDKKVVPIGPLVEIRTFLESGEDATTQTRVGLRELGIENGQHSGWENCVMRYDVADAYVANTNPSHRYVRVREVQGARLCDTTEGITVNAPGRNPQSRYGVAAPNRGVCKRQILVNDAVSAPDR